MSSICLMRGSHGPIDSSAMPWRSSKNGSVWRKRLHLDSDLYKPVRRARIMEIGRLLRRAQRSDQHRMRSRYNLYPEICKSAADVAYIQYIQSTVHEGLARLVSNAFGADTRPDDSLLTGTVDTWASLAGLLVRHGFKVSRWSTSGHPLVADIYQQWDNYIGSHQRESWASLRDTNQSRQCTGYFLSRCILADAQSYEVSTDAATSWRRDD